MAAATGAAAEVPAAGSFPAEIRPSGAEPSGAAAAPSPSPTADTPADPLSARVAAAGPEELARALRLVLGSDGGYWERHLVTGETWYSDNFLRLVGLPPEARREDMHALIHPEDRPAFDRHYAAAVQRIGPFEVDLRCRRADGSYRWARLQARVWPDATGRPERVIGMVSDVHDERVATTALREHQAELQRRVDQRTARLAEALEEARAQRHEAERALEVKSRFLAHMSHEIRTPLNGVLGLNELALREARGEQLQRYLALALESGRNLLEMLNGVLDFSRLAAGATPPAPARFDLPELLAAAVRQVMPQARRRQLGVMYDVHGGPDEVVGDAQRLRQVVDNLLSNAAKYTPSGHLALTLHTRPDGPGRCRARIEVSDTGPGMDAAMAERVFEPFVQGDDSFARRHGGTGLGLSIARGLAESMGGALTLETAPGAGARFRLELPLGCEEAGAEAVAACPAPPPGHAWLAYGLATPARWLGDRIARHGWTHEVLPGLPGVLARAATAAPGPALVVLAEAVLDDAATLAALRGALPDTRIVLLVRPDWNQPAIEAMARAQDIALAFMPLTPRGLHALLAGAPPARPDAAPTGGDATAPAGAGRALADVLIAEDNPVNQLIITEMIASLGLQPRLAGNGAEAVTACRAHPPQLVLMDVQMPEVDGLEATRQLCLLQREGRLRRFPIVALTAHASPQDRARCEAAGMQGFLTKPVSLGLLRSELRRWVAV
ncbi:hypothetical protein ISF6_0736 [Piscinibacter sakaiensis]|uniref:histidine kinase n=1 Tax=Piscinibacter sakaiensis TaxID=1547922 RepID=A0A0K8NZ33_PISS1|nr:hypothetical protein ISF6_0736 [Piscinibacter sakaiensis]